MPTNPIDPKVSLRSSKSAFATAILDLATIVEQLDAMFDKEEFQKAYDYIEKNKNEELFQSHYIQWRVAR